MSPFAAAIHACARAILLDLVGPNPARYPLSIRELSDLCSKHGGALLFDFDHHPRSAYCIGGEIVVSGRSSLPHYHEAVLHELVHRLADTERWEPLNRYVRRFADRRPEFLEALATRVGADFAARALRVKKLSAESAGEPMCQ